MLFRWARFDEVYVGGYPVMYVAVSSTVAMILQASAPEAIGAVAQIERLGLTGSLLLAVGILWRSLQAKDTQLTLLSQRVSEALAFDTETKRELRKIVEESTEAVHSLSDSISDLHAGISRFPCQLPDSMQSQYRVMPASKGL
jgi:hypothetical protein